MTLYDFTTILSGGIVCFLLIATAIEIARIGLQDDKDD